MREQFKPTILGLFINPFYFSRDGLYKHLSQLAQRLNGRVLDVGCGQKPYENIFKCYEYIGLEIDTPENRKTKKADYFYDGYTMPFPDESFDSVFLSQVFEHVFNPDRFFKEINRITMRGGCCS